MDFEMTLFRMPTKPRRPRRHASPVADSVSKRIAFNDRLAAVHADIARLRRARAIISRNEFVEVVNSLRQIQQHTDDIADHTSHLATQMTRIAHMQVEIDAMRRVLKHAKLMD